MNQSADGDTVLIHDGNYAETVVLYGKTITVGSLFLLDGDSNHIASTTVLPDHVRPDTGSCFVYAYGEGLEGHLTGLTLSGGTGTSFWSEGDEFWYSAGGAIYVVNHSSVAVANCCIESCGAMLGGGIAFVWDDEQDRTIQTQGRLTGCTVRDCRADFWGGGVYALWCSLAVAGCTFEENVGFHDGGMLLMNTPLRMDSCLFRRNFGGAGGLSALGCPGWIRGCLFEENGGNFICHLNVCDADIEISGCVFRNSAMGYPALGLADFQPGEGYAIRFVGNYVADNSATDISSTIVWYNLRRGEIAYNVIRNNVNVAGGAIQCFGNCTAPIHHNFFEGNVSLDPAQGSAVLYTYQGRSRLDSNLFFRNDGQVVTQSVVPYYPPRIHAENNWWGDPSGPYHPTRNPAGRGDTLLQDSIYFEPWLTEPPDISLPESAADEHRPAVPSTWQIVNAYPNPFNNEIRIVIAGFTGRDFRLTLHNLLGQEVAVVHSGALTGSDLAFRAPDHLASGVYFLRASEERAVQSKKIVLLK